MQGTIHRERHRAGGPIVPFARWGMRRPGGSLFRNALGALGDRVVWFAEDVLGEDLDARIARIRLSPNEAGYDPFGFDPAFARYALAASAFLHRTYFRTEVFGIENVPPGRVLFVANHSGQIPVDGVVASAALMLDADPPRFARNMVEKWSAQLPFVSVFFPRCGQVVGSPENARRLLESDEALIVFPEGARGISKTFENRYQLVDFGLGFMRLALETNTPIIPLAIIGGEEQLVSVANVKSVARVLGMPAFPIIPQLFLGYPWPLPVKYRLHFGEPLSFRGDADDDDAVIEQKVWVVRATIQSMVNRALQDRKAVFW